MAEPNRIQEDWPAPSFRKNVVEQLEEARRNSQAQMAKTSAEMEELIFQKARNKGEYFQYLEKVLRSVNSDHGSAKKEKLMASQQPPGMMPNMGQVVMPGMRQQGPVPGPDQDPINALQNLAGQGAGGMNRQPQQMAGMMPGMQGMMNPQQQHQQAQSRMDMMRAPHMQHTRAQLHGMHRPPQLARQDAFMVTSPQAMPGMPGQPLPASSMGYPGPGGAVRTMGPMGMPGQYMPGRDPNMVGMNMPGPNQTSPLQMMPSPMTSHSGMMPSPVGARNQMGVPSPNQMLHTPGTMVAEPSPGPPSTSQEELEYRKKLEKLSGYIEPLRKFVQDSEKKTDEESIKKFKSLLSILTTKNRVSMQVLEKCEQALHKLNSTPTSSSHGHMCQPLLDVVARFTTAPSLNHSLYRTFGPALEAYTGPAIRAPSPPPAKVQKLDEESPEELPDVIQGEIARLARRFHVSVDPRYHPGSESHHLVCKLEESLLPSVPPLLVKLPKLYPRASPQCDPDACSGYDATEFFQNVAANLNVHLANMPNKFCLTQLLHSWEMSVRKACDPDNPRITQPNPIFI